MDYEETIQIIVAHFPRDERRVVSYDYAHKLFAELAAETEKELKAKLLKPYSIHFSEALRQRTDLNQLMLTMSYLEKIICCIRRIEYGLCSDDEPIVIRTIWNDGPVRLERIDDEHIRITAAY